jgi:hypothetical protein
VRYGHFDEAARENVIERRDTPLPSMVPLPRVGTATVGMDALLG